MKRILSLGLVGLLACNGSSDDSGRLEGSGSPFTSSEFADEAYLTEIYGTVSIYFPNGLDEDQDVFIMDLYESPENYSLNGGKYDSNKKNINASTDDVVNSIDARVLWFFDDHKITDYPLGFSSEQCPNNNGLTYSEAMEEIRLKYDGLSTLRGEYGEDGPDSNDPASYLYIPTTESYGILSEWDTSEYSIENSVNCGD